MKFSLLFATVAFVAVAGAQASYDNRQQQRHPDGNPSYPLNDRFNENGCGYDCRNSLSYDQSRALYGPYHAYAVRPAVYGGHGIYHYRGYARHPLPPANAVFRPVSNHYLAPAPAGNYHAAAAVASHYGLRPVRALVLAPAYSGNGPHYASDAAHALAGPGYNGAAYRAPRGYGYNHLAAVGPSGHGPLSAGAPHHNSDYALGTRHYPAGRYNSDAPRYAAPAIY